MVGDNNEIQVWITKQYIGDPYPLYYSNKNNIAKIDSILFNLINEVCYDMHQMQFIYDSYLRALSNGKKSKTESIRNKSSKPI